MSFPTGEALAIAFVQWAKPRALTLLIVGILIALMALSGCCTGAECPA